MAYLNRITGEVESSDMLTDRLGVRPTRKVDANLAVDGYVRLKVTDTDGTVTGQLWYDASEGKLKFRDSTAVRTVTSA